MLDDIKQLDVLVEQGTGYTGEPYDPRDFDAEAFLGAPDREYPDEFLIDVPFVTNQGQIPSCTAHATTTMKWAQEGVRLSPRFNFAWSKFKDGYKGWGTTFHVAISILQDKGAVSETDYPDKNTLPENVYTDITQIPEALLEAAKEHTSKSFVRIERSKEAIMRALLDFKTPILTGCEWFKTYNRIGKNGMMDEMEGSHAGHAFVAIGWRTVNGEWQLICQNSFGTWWGDNGRFYVTEDKLNRLYSGMYVTIDLDKEEARKIDIEYKKKTNKPMLDLKKLEAEKKTLIFNADTGEFYLNTGDKLLKIAPERAAQAALMALTRAGLGLGVKNEYIDGLTVEQF